MKQKMSRVSGARCGASAFVNDVGLSCYSQQARSSAQFTRAIRQLRLQQALMQA
jgi:hypothetical protein